MYVYLREQILNIKMMAGINSNIKRKSEKFLNHESKKNKNDMGIYFIILI